MVRPTSQGINSLHMKEKLHPYIRPIVEGVSPSGLDGNSRIPVLITLSTLAGLWVRQVFGNAGLAFHAINVNSFRATRGRRLPTFQQLLNFMTDFFFYYSFFVRIPDSRLYHASKNPSSTTHKFVRHQMAAAILYSSPLVNIAHAVRTFLLANATAATFSPRRYFKSMTQRLR